MRGFRETQHLSKEPVEEDYDSHGLLLGDWGSKAHSRFGFGQASGIWCSKPRLLGWVGGLIYTGPFGSMMCLSRSLLYLE